MREYEVLQRQAKLGMAILTQLMGSFNFLTILFINTSQFHLSMASLEETIKWNKHIAATIDPVQFYMDHYKGLTRGQVRLRDQSLYETLRIRGLLDNVPLANSRFGDDPIAYYQKHYPGLTRGQLVTKNPSLYRRLRLDKLLEHIPKKAPG